MASSAGNSKLKSKPRILLIPNVASWIIGEMGKQIVERFRHQYDFYFVPEGLLERRPDLLRALVPAVDAIHCLNESSIDLFREFDQDALPPLATWIHHVTSWSSQHRMAVERSSALTVCTLAWKTYLDEKVSRPIPITIVPHGVDSTAFQKKEVDRGRFRIPRESFVVGFIGSRGSDLDGGRKGIDVFLRVVCEAAVALPTLHLVLGGPGWEDELAELKKLGISTNATGYVRKSDLPDLYSALDVYLSTSRIEGGPCTVFEAMSCETAVVATRVGAVPDLIVDGVNGYSADVDDVAALSQAILALAKAPANRDRMAKNARETVTKRPWKAVLSPLEEVYDRLIQLRRSRGALAPGPPWMDDPDALLRASCAADALANVIPRVRTRAISAGKGAALLREMLNRQNLVDIAKGALLIRGLAFRHKPESLDEKLT